MSTATFSGVAEQVARSLRAHRQARGLSLGELARQSGLSKASLSKLESGSANPSLETLWRLAGALDLSLGTLAGETDPPRTLLIRAHEGTVVESASGLRGRMLASEGHNHRTEVIAVSLVPDADYRAAPHAPGTEELLMCTEGSLRVGPVGREEELEEGDALRFPADLPHRYESAAGASALLVMSYPPSLGTGR